MDLTNQVFGSLKVLEKISDYPPQWKCSCICGRERYILQETLEKRHQPQKTCQCNRYKNWTPVFSDKICLIPLKNSIYATIDSEDYDKIKYYNWYVRKDGYVAIPNTKIRLHRVIMGATENEVVDHIFHNKLDNRKSQLRICTKSQNSMNQRLGLANTTGIKGVNYHKRNRKYTASIKINQKQHYLGSFSKIEEAQNARIEAEKTLFKEFSFKGVVI